MLLLIVFPGHGQTLFRAGYEIEIDIGDQHNSIQTMSRVTDGEVIEHNLGRYVLSMNIKEKTQTEFVLVIAITATSVNNKNKQTLLIDTYSGPFGGILEFKSSNEIASIKGAIGIGIIMEKN